METKVGSAPFLPTIGQSHCLSVSRVISHRLSPLWYGSRFRVIVEILKPEKPDLSVTLKGLDYIDVLSGSKKDYKLNFFAYKEGLYTAKVLPYQRCLPRTPEAWHWGVREEQMLTSRHSLFCGPEW